MKVEEGDKWREKAADRETWKGLTAGTVQQPIKGATRKYKVLPRCPGRRLIDVLQRQESTKSCRGVPGGD